MDAAGCPNAFLVVAFVEVDGVPNALVCPLVVELPKADCPNALLVVVGLAAAVPKAD